MGVHGRGELVGPLSHDRVEAREGSRVTTDDQHGQVGPLGQGRLEAGHQRRLDHEHPGVAVVQVVEVVVDPVHRVHRNRHGADPHRPQKGGGKGRRVVEDHEHALLALDPQLAQVAGDRRHQPS